MPNEEVYLVDEAGAPLPFGSVGELVVRGSHVMRGYWDKPEETARRLRPGRLPGEVVLHTGDIFRTDDEGYLYFVGRAGRHHQEPRREGQRRARSRTRSELLDGVLALRGRRRARRSAGRGREGLRHAAAGRGLEGRDVISHCLERLETFMVPKLRRASSTTCPRTETGKIRRASLR